MLKRWTEVSSRPDVLKALKAIEHAEGLPLVRHTISELSNYADWLRVYQRTLDADSLDQFLSKLNSLEREALHVLIDGSSADKIRIKRKIRSSLMRTTRMIDRAVQEVEARQ